MRMVVFPILRRDLWELFLPAGSSTSQGRAHVQVAGLYRRHLLDDCAGRDVCGARRLLPQAHDQVQRPAVVHAFAADRRVAVPGVGLVRVYQCEY